MKEHETGSFIQPLPAQAPEQNIVFSDFPRSSRLFTADFSPFSDSILERYGEHEFRAGVLANELHGHLGAYVIIGVKMGVRALDYFHCAVDHLEVKSFTGNTPPISCMNDGIQVSTGATLGHGLINVINNGTIHPMAEFYHKNGGIKISVKKEIAEQIRNDFKAIIDRNGLYTDEYWRDIRFLAIKYWREFDRNDIFNVNTVQRQ